MKAIILAGGEGSRLRPLTCDLPKPMVPIINKPVLEHTIELLKTHGIVDIGITIMYHPKLIKDYFGNGKSLGVNITYFLEEIPLGTAGGIKNAHAFLDETFIVISGDSLTTLNITEALDFHYAKNSLATLILSKVDTPLDYGVVMTDEDSLITGFLEKPSWGQIFSDTVNTGTYIFEPNILNYIESNSKVDFSRDVFPSLLANSARFFGYISTDYWCDIGDIRTYIKSHQDILDNTLAFKFHGMEIKENIWVGSGTIIESTAELKGPCVIGSNCRIGNGTVIDKYSIIGNNTTIEDDVTVVHSIIWDNSYVEYGSELRGAILCNRVRLKHYVSVFENAVIGEGCKINERVIIKPNIKIWPEKIIEPLAIVDRNMIWGSKHINKIFGENGISGLINVDISPEYATRLGAAYGSQFKIASRIVVSSTNSNSARMIKHAFISGLLSVGIEVYNMSSLLTPISRNAIKYLSVEGGIHIKMDTNNPNLLRIDFMDNRGCALCHLSERKIENSFFKEDFKRCISDQISRLNNITDFSSYYIRSILSDTNIPCIRERNLRICLFSPSKFVLSIMEPLLTNIGCTITSFITPETDNIDSKLAHMVTSKSDFAACIDSNGEKLVLINKDGTKIADDLFLAFISLIIFKNSLNSNIIIPITASEIIDGLAKKYDASIKRTNNCPQKLMEDILESSATDDKNRLAQFILYYDAIAGLAKIIEFLCISDTSLTELLSEIPDFYISRKSISCPWELKGMVMRTIINDHKEKKIELLDGIKLSENYGWVLILPDADFPIFRIIAEGSSNDQAEEISSKYYDIIERIIKSVA